jgi:P27 family predicted phage terminase small subunit
MARQTPPPADFDPHARAIWSAAQHQLRAQGTWTRTDVPLLTFYVRNVRLAQRAREAAEEMPFQRASTGPAMYAHVEYQIADKAEAAAMKCATELLLTAASRKRHGISISSNATSELDALVS